jgi:hypothetical protein
MPDARSADDFTAIAERLKEIRRVEKEPAAPAPLPPADDERVWDPYGPRFGDG